LAKKDGVLASYRKSLGTSAGIATTGIILGGASTAAVYFLGAEHPLVKDFLTAVTRYLK
jgi:NaMN:DMB phosphoribosyltransferase